MIVAEIALRQLSPSAKIEAMRLVSLGADEKNNTFVTASCWADDTKNASSGPWHYINWHFRDDLTIPATKPEGENIISAILRFERVLQNRSDSDQERAQALRYLLHFVGDIHQPMHNVARDSDAFPAGDRGGNDFSIGDCGLRPRPKNLHFLWDMACGMFPQRFPRPLDSIDANTLSKLAENIEKQYPKEKLDKRIEITEPERWSQEGLALARRYAYALQPGDTPSPEYLETGRKWSGYMMALAGYRLGAQLNRLLGSQSSSLWVRPSPTI